MGQVWWERPERKEECGGDWGGGRKPSPPAGLSQGSYLKVPCILDLPLPLAPAPPAEQGWETTGLPWELEAFWNPQRVFSTPPKAAVLCSRVRTFLLVGGGEEPSPGGEGGSWTRVMDTGSLRTCSAFSVEGPPMCIRVRVGAASTPFRLTLSTPPGSWQEIRTWQLIYHLWTRGLKV